MLRYFNKYKSLISIIRGYYVSFLFLPKGNGSKLRVGRNVVIKGDLKVGNDVHIESNVKIYYHTEIGDNTIIGDNVEIRGVNASFVKIGNETNINRNSTLIGLVSIGNNCSIAPGCVIVGSNHNFDKLNVNIQRQGLSLKGIKIENDVWLGANVVVLDGVSIGTGSIIGAGSVVTKSIPSFSIGVGNPCKVIKKRD